MENYFFKHSTHFGDMFGTFEDFYQNQMMSDVIISCDGKSIHAHRIVLCAGSDYFRRALLSVKDQTQLPVLLISDIAYDDMQAILEFIYRGQIVVSREKVGSLRQAAYKLRVKGFENFLRKPMGNGFGHGIGALSNNFTKFNRNGSLNENKRAISSVYEHLENQAKRMRNSSSGNFETALNFSRHNGHNDSSSKRHLNGGGGGGHHLENGHGNSPKPNENSASLKRTIHLDQLLRRTRPQIVPPIGSPNNIKNEYLSKAETDSVSITPIRGNESNHSASSESGDEQDDNQHNENAENMSIEKISNGHLMSKKEMHNDQQNGDGGDEADSEGEGVNYTYEMDPNSLNWGENSYNDENVPDNQGDDSDGYEDDEDYFETVNASNIGRSNSLNHHQMSSLRQFIQLSKLNSDSHLNGNGHKNGANFSDTSNHNFFCEHCPKSFFDEDHLQLHVKRSHGLNKMNACNLCGKTYAWKSGLYKHKRHVHGIGGKNLTQLNGENMIPENALPTANQMVVESHAITAS